MSDIPGHIGIFEFIAKSRAISLLPIDLIDAGLGPIHLYPESYHMTNNFLGLY